MRCVSAGAAYGDELGYLFHTNLIPAPEAGTIEQELVQRMVRLWTNFAKGANPNPITTDMLINLQWKPVQLETMHFLNIGEHLTLQQNPDEDRIRFWNGLLHVVKEDVEDDDKLKVLYGLPKYNIVTELEASLCESDEIIGASVSRFVDRVEKLESEIQRVGQKSRELKNELEKVKNSTNNRFLLEGKDSVSLNSFIYLPMDKYNFKIATNDPVYKFMDPLVKYDPVQIFNAEVEFGEKSNGSSSSCRVPTSFDSSLANGGQSSQGSYRTCATN